MIYIGKVKPFLVEGLRWEHTCSIPDTSALSLCHFPQDESAEDAQTIASHAFTIHMC